MTRNKNNLVLLAISSIALAVFCINYQQEVTKSYKEIYKTDYPNYYFAGVRLLNNQPVYKPIIEDVKKLLEWDQYIAYTADTPLTVVILAPLSVLDIHSGSKLLNFISILLTCLSVLLLANAYGSKLLLSLFFTTLAISSVAFIFMLKKCHMESILLFSCCLGLISLKRSAYKTCGLYWGFASALKIFPLLWLLPYFFNKSKKNVFYSGMISFLIFSTIPCTLFQTEDLAAYILEVIPKSKIWYGTVGNYSIISYFTALLGYEKGKYLAILFSLIIIIYLVSLLYKAELSDQRAYALSSSSALLLSPLSWLNYFILTFPILIFLSSKYTYSHLKNFIELLLLFAIFWCWPDYVETPWYTLSLSLSFMPMFALFSILFYFHKKL